MGKKCGERSSGSSERTGEMQKVGITVQKGRDDTCQQVGQSGI